MHKAVYLFAFDGMADWEYGYRAAELNSGRYFDAGIAYLHEGNCALLILPGGESWHPRRPKAHEQRPRIPEGRVPCLPRRSPLQSGAGGPRLPRRHEPGGPRCLARAQPREKRRVVRPLRLETAGASKQPPTTLRPPRPFSPASRGSAAPFRGVGP